MVKTPKVLFSLRRIHFWLAVFCSPALFIVSLTGVILIFRSYLPIVQAPTLKGTLNSVNRSSYSSDNSLPKTYNALAADDSHTPINTDFKIPVVDLLLPIEKVITIAQAVPEAKINSWEDIKSLEVKLANGIYSVRTKTYYEVQVDIRTGQVLFHGPRWTPLLVQWHEGQMSSWSVFPIYFKLSAIGFVILYFSGTLLLVYTLYRKILNWKSQVREFW